MPIISFPKKTSLTMNGICLSLLKISSSSFLTSIKLVLKTLSIKAFAKTTFTGGGYIN